MKYMTITILIICQNDKFQYPTSKLDNCNGRRKFLAKSIWNKNSLLEHIKIPLAKSRQARGIEVHKYLFFTKTWRTYIFYDDIEY